jgi:hypothetical protein
LHGNFWHVVSERLVLQQISRSRWRRCQRQSTIRAVGPKGP